MTIPVKLRNGGALDICAKVSSHGGVSTFDCPPDLAPIGTENRIQFFRTSITGMNTDGSTNPIDYQLVADQNFDIFITKILIVIEDSKVKEDKYGSIASLTNGVDLLTFESGTENYLIEAGKNYGQLKAQTGDTGSEVKIKSTGAEIGVVSINLSDFVPGGVRIGRKSKDRISFIVNDDLTGLDSHTIYFLGNKHIK